MGQWLDWLVGRPTVGLWLLDWLKTVLGLCWLCRCVWVCVGEPICVGSCTRLDRGCTKNPPCLHVLPGLGLCVGLLPSSFATSFHPSFATPSPEEVVGGVGCLCCGWA